MVSTFTPNIQLEEPARGDDVGVWDTPVNNNMSLIDLVAGGITTISLNNSNVTLNAAQYQCSTIVFNSTLTGSVTITFPTSFKKSWWIRNACTGSSAFTVTLQTTASTTVVCPPPFDNVSVLSDGASLGFQGLVPIGSYWDYAGSSVPNWVSGSSPAPYLNCDGATFSSAAYPALTVILGGTTLPDSRGRARLALDQGVGRISTAATGFSGSGVGGSGGTQTTTLGTSNLPAYTPTGTVASSITQAGGATQGQGVQPGAGNIQYGGTGSGAALSALTVASVFTGVAQGGVSQAMTNLPPAYIGGLTLIRAG